MSEAGFVWIPIRCSNKGCLLHSTGHVENCYRCAGFGHWRGVKGDTFIIAEEALNHVFGKDEYTPCSMCGGKPPKTMLGG